MPAKKKAKIPAGVNTVIRLLKKKRLRWDITNWNALRCAKGDCPMVAAARIKDPKKAERYWSSGDGTWEQLDHGDDKGATKILGVDLATRHAVVEAADSPYEKLYPRDELVREKLFESLLSKRAFADWKKRMKEPL